MESTKQATQFEKLHLIGGSFADQLRNFLIPIEFNSPVLYYDSIGLVSTGIGDNINSIANRDKYFQIIGLKELASDGQSFVPFYKKIPDQNNPDI